VSLSKDNQGFVVEKSTGESLKRPQPNSAFEPVKKRACIKKPTDSALQLAVDTKKHQNDGLLALLEAATSDINKKWEKRFMNYTQVPDKEGWIPNDRRRRVIVTIQEQKSEVNEILRHSNNFFGMKYIFLNTSRGSKTSNESKGFPSTFDMSKFFLHEHLCKSIEREQNNNMPRLLQSPGEYFRMREIQFADWFLSQKSSARIWTSLETP